MQTTGGSGLALTGNAQDGNLRLHVTTTDWVRDPRRFCINVFFAFVGVVMGLGRSKVGPRR